MKLILLERFTTLGILPKESNFATLKIVRELQEALSLSEAEVKEFELKQDGGQYKWNKKGNEEREIKIGEKATDIIVEALKELDNSKKLTPNHVPLWEKFVKD